MKYKLLFLLVPYFATFTPITASESNHYDARFEQANGAYKIGAYDSAKTIYNEILSSGLTSPDLLYNLGNTHYKLGNISSAILYYERAHELSPWDVDIQYNLATAKSQTTDKMQSVTPMFMTRWLNATASSTTSNIWGWLIVLFITLACVGFSFFFLTRSSVLKPITLIATMAMLGLAILSSIFGYRSYVLEGVQEAIVFAPSVNVKSEPLPSSTVLFVVHEGLKVEVLQEEESWVRVKFEDGNTGWLPSQSIETI